jgi:ATP/maltotriose-dependent transcriptional regulator MalT
MAGKYHDHVERASCNLSCTYFWHRDYQASLDYIERGVAYAAAWELGHWEVYLRGWRAMVRVEQGEWSEGEEEAQEICSRSYSVEMYRFPALIALARLRIRRGDLDAEIPLEAARRLASNMGELQRSVYIACADAEAAWLSGAASARAAAVAALRGVHDLARERHSRWVVEDTALWLHMLGEPVETSSEYQAPYRDHCEDRHAAAAAGWRSLNRPYEEAIALSGGDDASQRQALEIFDRMGAVPAAARLRKQMRANGLRAVPRGPIANTRANAAGLTRRQVQVLALVDEGLSNTEIAGRLSISAKTAEHHVSAIMARLDAPTRQKAAANARNLGLLGILKR